ncbi:hypothetical protein RND81_09G101900 [Saponaria officinalis]|uniref:Protein kinase domain-containing protein n=1 Tax=Saponaria officinalis TaxID=3572 RepID=A0AAW1IL19_SAPOF
MNIWHLAALRNIFSAFPRNARNVVTLTWLRRIKIALDAAKGFAFLHGLERQIIYRDFKTSNILLDSCVIGSMITVEDWMKFESFGLNIVRKTSAADDY